MNLLATAHYWLVLVLADTDGNSAVMLVAACLRHVAGTKWGSQAYMDMTRLREGKEAELAMTE